jgi:iron-sulfur cluster assembly protein
MIPVQITKNARQEIVSIKNTKGVPEDYYLRIGVRGGGCSGVDYYVGFDQEKASDKKYDLDGVTLLIEKKDFMHLIGVSLDFVEYENQRGFKFNKE